MLAAHAAKWMKTLLSMAYPENSLKKCGEIVKCLSLSGITIFLELILVCNDKMQSDKKIAAHEHIRFKAGIKYLGSTGMII